jgi:hypothetical protein
MTMEEKPNTDAYLAGVIRDFLGEDRSICLFEDAMASPTDGWIRSDDERIRILDDEVYFVLSKRDATDEERIARTIKNSFHGWHFVCVMSALPEKDWPSMPERNLRKDDVKAIAESAEKIVVDAYDGEGCLVWVKSYRG